jgi:hypothetical protein
VSLPTVPVDVDKVSERHFIAVDGYTARIFRISPPLAAGDPIVLHWTIIDPAPADQKDVGKLTVAADGTVDCVRYADWLASRNGGDSRG